MKQRLKNLSHYLIFFLIGVGLIAVYKTFDNFNLIVGFIFKILNILSPFIAALVIAFLLFAPSSFLEKLLLNLARKKDNKFLNKHSRLISVLITYIVVFALISALVIFAVPNIINALSGFVKSLPDYVDRLNDLAAPFFEEDGLLKDVDIPKSFNQVYTEYLQPYVTPDNILNSVKNILFKGVLGFTTSLIDMLMALIVSIYMLLSRESLLRTIRTFFKLFLKEKTVKTVGSYGRRSSAIFYQFLYSQAIDALVVGVLMSIGCAIAGAPNPILLGFLIGLLNMIPYFGAIIGGVGVALITLLSVGPYQALFLGIYIIVMQQIDANLIQPKIVGETVGIKPIYVLLSITLGGGLFGVAGIFLGVPAMGIIQMLFRDVVK